MTAKTYPAAFNRTSRAAIVYVYPTEPGIVWTDQYPDIATAQRNLVHYAAPAQVIPLPPTCQHGRAAGQCDATSGYWPQHRYWWDSVHFVTTGVCIHHPSAA